MVGHQDIDSKNEEYHHDTKNIILINTLYSSISSTAVNSFSYKTKFHKISNLFKKKCNVVYSTISDKTKQNLNRDVRKVQEEIGQKHIELVILCLVHFFQSQH